MIEIFHAHSVVFTSIEVQKVGCFAVSLIVSSKPVTLRVLYHMTQALAPVYEGGTLLFLFRLPDMLKMHPSFFPLALFWSALSVLIKSISAFSLGKRPNQWISILCSHRHFAPGQIDTSKRAGRRVEFGSNTVAIKSLDLRVY